MASETPHGTPHADAARSQNPNQHPKPTPTRLPSALLDELATHAAAIASGGAAVGGATWGAVHKLLLKAKADPQAAARLISTRDASGLVAMVRALRGEAPDPAASEPLPATAPTAPAIDDNTQKRAIRAFRKRLRLIRLDRESKLGVGPMSGGRRHEVDAIEPPSEFPMAVWAALADAGKLRREGKGFYALVNELEEE